MSQLGQWCSPGFVDTFAHPLTAMERYLPSNDWLLPVPGNSTNAFTERSETAVPRSRR